MDIGAKIQVTLKEFYHHVMLCVLYKIDHAKQSLNKCESSNTRVVSSIRDLISGDEENANSFGTYSVMDKLPEFPPFEYNDKTDAGPK